MWILTQVNTEPIQSMFICGIFQFHNLNCNYYVNRTMAFISWKNVCGGKKRYGVYYYNQEILFILFYFILFYFYFYFYFILFYFI